MLVRDKLSKLISNLKSYALCYKLWAPLVPQERGGGRGIKADGERSEEWKEE